MFGIADISVESNLKVKSFYTYNLFYDSKRKHPLQLFMKVANSLYNDCLWKVDDNECFGSSI